MISMKVVHTELSITVKRMDHHFLGESTLLELRKLF